MPSGKRRERTFTTDLRYSVAMFRQLLDKLARTETDSGDRQALATGREIAILHSVALIETQPDTEAEEDYLTTSPHTDEAMSERRLDDDEIIFDGEPEDSYSFELYVSEDAEFTERNPGVVLKLAPWMLGNMVMSTTGHDSFEWEQLDGTTKRYRLGRDLAVAYRKLASILKTLRMMPTKPVSITYILCRHRGENGDEGLYQATALEWEKDGIGWTEAEALSNLRHAISILLLGRKQHHLPEPVQVMRVGRMKVKPIEPLEE